MKQLFTLLFCALGSLLFAQSNFTVFNNDGQQFFVIMNGIKQNTVPQTNVSVSGVKNGGYSVKVIFADGKTPDINKNFMIDSPMDITTQVVFKKGQGKLQLVSMEPTAGSVVNGAVIYRQDNNVIYSDAPVVNVQTPQTNTTITSTQTIPSNVNGNVQVNETQTQTNMNTSNQNMNGNVNMNVGISGNVGINGTTSTNGQNGNINMNTNVNSNGMNVTVNDPISGENVNMNLNVGFNTNGTTMTVTDPLLNGNINMNVDMNGMPISNSTSTVTTTSSQTINGQTTYQTGSTTTQNNNGNVTVTTTGTPDINGNINMNTNMNTNPNMNGNVNMNSNINTSTNGNVNMNSNQNTTTTTVVTNGNFINCSRMLLDTDEFIADLKTQTFEDDRIDIIYKDLVKTCVTAAQVYKILELITFESSKYEVAQFLYFRTSDRQLLEKGMLPLFTFDSTKMDWREFVRQNQ